MRINDLQTPALIADMDVLEENIRTAQRMADENGFKLRPHYKSHKSTAIAHWQIDAGAKGMTAAKLAEAEDLAEAGIEDILIANQITDAAKIARAASLAKCCRLSICVDSVKNVDDLENAAAAQNSMIYVLPEYDIGMNRCGVRHFDEVLDLAKHIVQCPHLGFGGIQAYAGQLSHELVEEERKRGVLRYEEELKQLKQYIENSGIRVNEISGASTGTIGYRTKDTVYTEVQAGTYLFMDTSYNRLNTPFRNSLYVLTSVISLSGDRVIMDAGVKCLGADQTPAIIAEYPDAEIIFSEEHSAIRNPHTDTQIGDKYRLIPGHSCTTVNLHDFLYLVRKDKVIDKIPVTSRGGCR